MRPLSATPEVQQGDMGRQRFQAHHRIQRQADIDRLLARGVRVSDRLMSVLLLRNDFAWSRLAVRVPKRVGTAVRRNLIRRRLREAFRQHRDLIPKGVDILCLVKPAELHAFGTLRDSLIRLTGLAASRHLPSSKGKSSRAGPDGP